MYLPVLESQKAIWNDGKGLKPYAIHSRWLFDGSCKSPSEELGFWVIWGRGTPFADSGEALKAISMRDFGSAANAVRRAWAMFSEAMCHHPSLDYYVGSYFIGPAQPLCLAPDPDNLEDVLYGVFYWQWEVTAGDDQTALTRQKPLFYDRPGFKAVARRGPDAGHDVALKELRTLADLWERGARPTARAAEGVPESSRQRLEMEVTLATHLAYTWRSAANVEEFLRLRDVILEHSGQSWVRQGHARENLRDHTRMVQLARHELDLAQLDLELVRDVDYLDLSLRLDMGVASTASILEAKIRQVTDLIDSQLPEMRDRLIS